MRITERHLGAPAAERQALAFVLGERRVCGAAEKPGGLCKIPSASCPQCEECTIISQVFA
jgi:hypothetical protein